MSDCGVCVGGYDFDGYPEFHETRWPKARKEHTCADCGETIRKGEKYHRWSGKYDGEFFDEIRCLTCQEIWDAFTCANFNQTGPPAGELWADMTELVFPGLTTSCFDKLQTPAAKAELQRRWMKWKGLAA